MAVVFDAKGTATGDGTSPLSFSTLTIGTGTNRALFVGIVYINSLTPNPTATWNGTSVPLIVNNYDSGSNFGSAVFALANPASGTNALVITGTGAAEIHAIGVSFTGVDQTTPAQNSNSNTQFFITSGSLAITSAVGDMVFGSWALSSVLTANSGTLVGSSAIGPSVDFAANYDAGASTVTLTTTGTGTSTVFVSAGVDIKASTGGGPTLMGSSNLIFM